MTLLNIGVAEHTTYFPTTLIFYAVDRVCHILSSTDLIMGALEFKLVMKYATSPKVL